MISFFCFHLKFSDGFHYTGRTGVCRRCIPVAIITGSLTAETGKKTGGAAELPVVEKELATSPAVVPFMVDSASEKVGHVASVQVLNGHN